MEKNFTILLVEDDGCVRITLRAVLQHAGYKVIETDCAKSALAAWETHKEEIGLLLTDYNMPGMTGTQLAEVLHTEKPDLQVVVASGRYGGDIVLPPFALFLQKPFSTLTLLEVVEDTFAILRGELSPSIIREPATRPCYHPGVF